MKTVSLAILALVVCSALGLDAASKRKWMFRRAKASSLISPSANEVSTYLFETPRSYPVVLMLTATDPQFNCGPCVAVHEIMESIASGYQTQRYAKSSTTPRHQLFFVSLDYSQKYAPLFQEMGVNGVPRIMYIPPETRVTAASLTKSLEGENTYDLNSRGLDGLSTWIQQRSGIRLTVAVKQPQMSTAPVRSSGTSGMSWQVTAVVCTIAASPVLYKFRRSPTMYFILFVGVYLWSISGAMYNHIRGMPWFKVDAQGRVTDWMTEGLNAQLGAEGLATGVVQTLAGIIVLLLNTVVVTKKMSPTLRNALVVGLVITVFFLFGLMRSWFGRKIGGYNDGYVWDWRSTFV